MIIKFAKSGRSKCKKCKEPIVKDAIRIIVEVEGVADYTMSSNFHMSCFSIPKPYKDQSAAYFVQNILQDKAIRDGTAATGKNAYATVLPDHENEIIAAMEMASSSSKKRKSVATGNDGDGTATTTPISQLKLAYMERCAALGEPTSAASQPNQKKSKGRANAKNDHSENIENDRQPIDVVSSASFPSKSLDMIDYYGMYHKCTIDELKDILRQNRQNMTGTKDILLYKVIDGCYYNGRITFCPLCTTGRLKLIFTTAPNSASTVAMVQCNGTFDEMIQRRMDCSYNCLPCDAVRQSPFYSTQSPTDAENEMMDAYEESIKNGTALTTSTTTATSSSHGTSTGMDMKSRVKEHWCNEAVFQLEWNLSNRDGIRAATKGLVEILLNQNKNDMAVTSSSLVKGKKESVDDTVRLDIPTNVDEALQKVGPVIATNKDKSVIEIIDLLIQQFGWYSDKVQKQQMKQNTISQIVQHPDNTSLVLALQELSELYFKTGNANAGISYKKVATAVQTLPYAITSDNAKQLGSGKNKVANIGKSSADKIYEYVTTGTIQKLMEKRAEVA
jgi:Helix-hairpin-helix domain